MIKKAVVTGAARGIGRAIAKEFLKRDWEVWVIDVLEEVELDWVGKAHPVILDLTNPDAIKDWVNSFKSENSALDTLVNNAGAVDFAPVVESDPDRLDKLMQLNLMAPVRLTQGLLPALLASKGRVIHIGSEVVRATGAFSLYGITKCALQAYADVCRQEMKLLGLESILIRPGAIDTDILPASRAKAEGKFFIKYLQRFNEIAPSGMKNPAQPDAVGALVYKAATTLNPKPVYGIGENPALKIMALLPQSMRDKIFLSMLRK